MAGFLYGGRTTSTRLAAASWRFWPHVTDQRKEISYQGTADAVRQHLRYLQQPGIEYVLILSGDQLYHMNYNEMLETHKKSKADVTIAALPVDAKQAAGFGIMRLDDEGRVQGFLEKPKTQD